MQPLQECKSGGDGGAAPEKTSPNPLRQREADKCRGTTCE